MRTGQDQVAKYGRILQCALKIGHEQDIQGAYDGSHQLLYSSPESVLGDAQLRDMLCFAESWDSKGFTSSVRADSTMGLNHLATRKHCTGLFRPGFPL